MEKICEISLLLDFYGPMLTERQYEILDLHFNSDYSLGEIAEHLNISRQGVYDNIKRSKFILNELEQKLGLVRKFLEQKNKAKEILSHVKHIDSTNMSVSDKQRLRIIEDGIHDIINRL